MLIFILGLLVYNRQRLVQILVWLWTAQLRAHMLIRDATSAFMEFCVVRKSLPNKIQSSKMSSKISLCAVHRLIRDATLRASLNPFVQVTGLYILPSNSHSAEKWSQRYSYFCINIITNWIFHSFSKPIIICSANIACSTLSKIITQA